MFFVCFVLGLIFGHVACGILVSQQEIEYVPPAVEAFSLNHWITREVLEHLSFKRFSGCYIIFTIKRENRRREMRASVKPFLAMLLEADVELRLFSLVHHHI